MGHTELTHDQLGGKIMNNCEPLKPGKYVTFPEQHQVNGEMKVTRQ